MTIKELADFTGKNKSTVGRWVAKCNTQEIYDKVQNATQYNPADFDVDEVSIILSCSSLSKDAVSVLMQNARQKTPAQSVEVDYEAIGKMIGMAVAAALTPVVDRLDKMSSSHQLQIEAPKQDYFSLVGYCSLNKIKTNMSELSKMGMDLKKMAKDSGKELHKIPDERWGKVNSYPVEILDEYFQV